MNRLALTLAGVASLVAVAPAAAETFRPGAPNFRIAGNINNGPVTATLSNVISTTGAFQDSFLFTLDQNGFGSGALTSGTTALFSSTDLDIQSVFVNGMAALKSLSDGGRTESFTISNVPILFGVQNSIVVTGTSRGLGSYGGNATFMPSIAAAVPEPATWAMMIIGFGFAGSSLRRRRVTTSVSFA